MTTEEQIAAVRAADEAFSKMPKSKPTPGDAEASPDWTIAEAGGFTIIHSGNTYCVWDGDRFSHCWTS